MDYQYFEVIVITNKPLLLVAIDKANDKTFNHNSMIAFH